MEPPIGLIAGEGRLPVLTAAGIRHSGREVACVGLRGQFDRDLPRWCDRFRTAGIIQIGRWIRLLRRAGAEEAVMVGRVRKQKIYAPLRVVRQIPDWRAGKIWYRTVRDDRRNDRLLTAVADELAGAGVPLVDSTRYIPDQLATEGLMTERRPTAAQWADVEFGRPIAERLAALDVGQAIAVHDREVLAVEAIEGSDAMIRRAGELCRGRRWTLLKIAKPQQDMRFDVPTVGVNTIHNLRAAGAGCLALEAGRVIMLDRSAILDEAERAGIAVVGMARGDPEAREAGPWKR